MTDSAATTATLGYRPFDADNHYYEAVDAFSRHLDPCHATRVFEWARIGKRSYPVLAGKVFRGVKNATFDPVAYPGILADYFRGNPNGDDPLELLSRHEPIRPAYRDRDARLATMDAHGLDKVWLFPTLGMIYEDPLKHDPGAVKLLFTAFNRWLDEDWGFAYQDRIFAAPYFTLVDVEWACAELEWAIGRGARTIVTRPAAPTTVDGPRSPGHTDFDPFWARVNEAGITVVVHAGDSGYTSHGYATDGFTTDFGGVPQPIKMLQLERPIEDWLSSLVCDNLFHRFPNLRVASVENGSKFLPGMFERLQVVGRKMNGWFPEDPVETFRRHVWVNPFWEDHVDDVIDAVGVQRVIFGSDWPHIEGLPEPLDYVAEVKHLAEHDQKRILADNAAELTLLRPT
ncbi:MAG: putative TIM-barrel fold metal-dependent hydrolase [Acidimicrobiales bacterium]|nr:putative TIM-barrel fold metal-dependent hydrolase [Acidimicrobiales bacterium]